MTENDSNPTPSSKVVGSDDEIEQYQADRADQGMPEDPTAYPDWRGSDESGDPPLRADAPRHFAYLNSAEMIAALVWSADYHRPSAIADAGRRASAALATKDPPVSSLSGSDDPYWCVNGKLYPRHKTYGKSLEASLASLERHIREAIEEHGESPRFTWLEKDARDIRAAISATEGE